MVSPGARAPAHVASRTSQPNSKAGVTFPQRSIELLIAMIYEAQQRQMDDPLIELLQPEDRIIRDERRIILHVLIGDVERGYELFGHFVESMNLVPPANFTAHLPGAKVPGFTLEAGDGIQPLRLLQQA